MVSAETNDEWVTGEALGGRHFFDGSTLACLESEGSSFPKAPWLSPRSWSMR